jgi:hypothetical protein
MENHRFVTIAISRSGATTQSARVEYATEDVAGWNDCSMTNGFASSRCDYARSLGSVIFAPGETTKSVTIPIVNDAYAEGEESFVVRLSNASGASLGSTTTNTIKINDNWNAGTGNPLDEATFFVRQHYLDFLNREPDADGLAFWTSQINDCADERCRENKRVNVSAAFFQSIEFQQTGFFAYRLYKVGFGDGTSPNVNTRTPIVRLQEFLADAQFLGRDVRVGIGNWQEQLAANRTAFAREFVARQRFLNAFPLTMTASQFVDRLNQNAGSVLTPAERSQLIVELTANGDVTDGRAKVLAKIAENAILGRNESNRAFVLMQYYGYLRRNPDDPQDTDFRGWEFWLNKLNHFNGNFVDAEMVKAFLTSGEYRHRFGR